MAVLCWMNTIQYSPQSGLLYATGVSRGPPESSTQTASRSLQPLLPGSRGDRPTDRPTDHDSLLVTIGGAHSEKPYFVIVYGYNMYVFIGAVDSTDRINFSNQQLYSAVRLNELQCIWRHTAICAVRERFPPAYSTSDTTVYLFTDAQAV